MKNPDTNDAARLDLATTLLKQGYSAEARQQIVEIGRRLALTPKELMVNARAFLKEGDLENARRSAEEAQKLQPSLPFPTVFLSDIARQLSGPEEKIKLLTRHLDKFKNNHEVRRNLAEFLNSIGNHQACREQIDTIVSSGSGTFRDHLIIAKSYLAEGNIEKAKVAARKSNLMDPSRIGPVKLLADCAHLEKGYAEKVALFEVLAPATIQDFALTTKLAEGLLALGRKMDALTALEKIRLHSCDDNELFRLVTYYERIGRIDLADACYESMNALGDFGAIKLFQDVLKGKVPKHDALQLHQDRGLAKDSAYLALNEYLKITEVVPRGDDNEDISIRLRQVARDYAIADAYFHPSAKSSSRVMPLITILAPIHRAVDEENLLKQILRQDYPSLEIIIIANGPGINKARLKQELEEVDRFAKVTVAELPEDTTVSTALNLAIEAAEGEYLARFDADDIYLESYLSRTIRLMEAFGADFCGKPDLFIHLEKFQGTVVSKGYNKAYQPRPKTANIACGGSSLFASASMAKKIGFDENLLLGEDRDFYFRAHASGFQIVWAPPFDHIVVRRASNSLHTWSPGDMAFFQPRNKNQPFFPGSLEFFESKLSKFTE
ncbi:glycosyltransferase [Ruegeria sp. 1NDH52C]|uniref:Glycosyltransferase n=1 Tax=Ruegeria alba TaxID=2916756 RepID=A0ABS9NZA2_9RHOB|nr:glycosyltransferase [Ruegeria alba]MCG6559568.1 glycosyltransferase [Ruegeria alba]